MSWDGHDAGLEEQPHPAGEFSERLGEANHAAGEVSIGMEEDLVVAQVPKVDPLPNLQWHPSDP